MMTNAEKFQEVFGIYATEMWAMSEQDFLKWLNTDAPQACQDCKYLRWNSEIPILLIRKE